MKAERLEQVSPIFRQALEVSTDERAAFLETACAGDTALRNDVEQLISAHEGAGSFIEAPAYEKAAVLLTDKPADSLVGQLIQHYRIVALLGKGGMGEVYLASDTRMGRNVALKLLLDYLTRDEQRVARFQQEARAVFTLNHPNIVTIYEIGEVDGVHFIASEFIEGETLRERMTRQEMKLGEALEVAIQVASALSAAHQKGVVHRDIKPENIMLRPDGYVKVLDFGIAKLTERPAAATSTSSEAPTMMQVKTDPGMVIGTAHYMSPEQARGAVVDARSDIWSLGCVLYEMIAGRVPFEGATPSDTISAILEKQPPPLARYAPEAPTEVQWLVNKALRKNREERCQTVKEMLGDLRELSRELEVQARIEHTAPPHSPVAAKIGTSSEQPQIETRNEAAQTTEPAAIHTTSSAEYIVTGISRHKTKAVIALALLIIGVGIALAMYKFAGRGKTTAPFQNIKITRLTVGGRSGGSAAISPDGKYVVYAMYERSESSLWVRQVSSNSAVEIVPHATGFYQGSTFSHDGNSIYYIFEELKDGMNPSLVLYQVTTLGGTPRKLLSDIDSPVTLSPDDKQMAFIRLDGTQRAFSLIVANADGSGERTLATRRNNEVFSLGGPAWSPDGKVIACGAGILRGNDAGDAVVEVSVTDGAIKPITSQKWLSSDGGVHRLVWLADGSGLVMAAVNGPLGNQMWYVSYPAGEVRRITNDLSDYGEVSLGVATDSSALVAAQREHSSRIWVTAPNEDASRARQITNGKFDGYFNLSWTPDGKIVYATSTGDDLNLWIINGEGTGNKQLTSGPNLKGEPSVSADGRYVFYGEWLAGTVQPHIWRMDADGSNTKQLTFGDDFDWWPASSPDGKWVAFNSLRSGKHGLWKVGIDGGEPVLITNKLVSSSRVSFSPDGKLIVCIYRDDQMSPPRQRAAIISVADGQPTKVFDLPPNYIPWPGLQWTPDGRALDYVAVRDDVSNVWRLLVDGGKPLQLTNFKDTDSIRSFALSRDGKQLAIARGPFNADVILIRDLNAATGVK